MNWKEMTGLQKVFFILVALCFIAGFSITTLNIAGVLDNTDLLEDAIDCAFWLCMGIAFWKKKSPLPIVCFAAAVLKLIFVFI